MNTTRFTDTRAKRMTLRIGGGLLALFLILVAAMFLYVHVNREKLATLLQDKLEETFHGNVQIRKVRLSVFSDFPHFALTLTDTEVKDSLYGEPLLDIEKIHLRVNVFDLLQRTINVRAITLEHGTISLFKDSSGYANTSLFTTLGSKQQSSGEQLSFLIKQFVCNDIAFIYREQRLGKNFSIQLRKVKGKVIPDDEEIDISLAGAIYIDSLLFRPDKGSYLIGKQVTLNAQMVLNRATRELEFKPTTVVMDGQQYAMSGCFILRKPLFLNLYIDNYACNFDKAKTALSSKIQQSLASFSLNQPVELHVSITGESEPYRPPMVDVSVVLKRQQLRAYNLDFSNMNMVGLFTNHLQQGVRNDKNNSGIFLYVKVGRMEYIPFTATVSIKDLEKLYCRADWNTSMDMTDFNMHEVFEDFYFNKGHAVLDLFYAGNLSNYKDSIAINFNDTLRGLISIRDAVLEYPGRQLSITDINTEVYFNQEEFNIGCLSAMLNDNSIELSGQMSGVRRLLTEDVDKMNGTFDLYSPEFNISSVLLGKRKAAEPLMERKKTGFTFLPKLVRRIVSDMKFNIAIKANTLRFRNLTAQHVTGDLRLSAKGLALNNLQMYSCRGAISFSALLDTRSGTDKFEAKAVLKDVDVKQFFRSADNFSQDAITHENLSGSLTAQASFSGPLDSLYNPVTDSIRAKIFFSLKDGELTNYGPVAEIDNFIFRKRDMENIRFAEIKDTLVLNGKEMTIMKMEVASSVVRLFVKGKYTFNGPAEIYVQVPLRNLRKPDADAAMKNFNLDEKAGASIFLKVHGTAGNLKVSLSPAGRREMKREEDQN